jgi:triphosphoribosyl-dephospho-CoA synthase
VPVSAAPDHARALRSAADVASAAQLACLLEASAPKPGNVAPGAPFRDMCYEDFLASAAAIGPAFLHAGERPLGATILEAIQATTRFTRANTNLGIVLLLAPLARAARAPGDGSLRERLARVLAETTVQDAVDVYAAIRLARPAGLGRAESQDVSETPTIPLRAAMALAAERDGIAREYATDFVATFEIVAPALARARSDGLDWNNAVVETFLTLLAVQPDTHIARKLGTAAAAEVSERARAVLHEGGVRTSAGRARLAELDRVLRDPMNAKNPGTTADLTAGGIYVVLLEDGNR